MLVHGATRERSACGSTDPFHRVRDCGGVDLRVPRRRAGKRCAAFVERVPGACRSVSCRRRRGRPGCCAISRGRVPRELGPRTGSPLAPRAASCAPTRSHAQGRACRLVRSVLAHTVRGEGDRRRATLPVTATRASARTSSPERGAPSRPVTWCVPGCSHHRTARTSSTDGSAMLVRRRSARAASSTALTPSCGRRPSRHPASRTQASSRESPAVREESQLDDMRSAIRGDFERLAERRGEQELMRVPDVSPAPEPEPAAARSELEPPRSWFARFISP